MREARADAVLWCFWLFHRVFPDGAVARRQRAVHALWLCLGAGVAANKLYQTEMSRGLGRRRFNALTSHPAYSVCAQGVAVSYFILILGYLWVPAIGVDALGAWTEAAGLVVAGVLLLIVLIRAANRPATRLARVLADATGIVCFVQAAAVLVYLVLLRGFVPPLLYEYF